MSGPPSRPGDAASGPPPTLAFAEFRDYLAVELEVDLSERQPGDRLGTDLELDSLQRLEALVAVEELGVYLPDNSTGPEQTLGGLHELYRVSAAAESA